MRLNDERPHLLHLHCPDLPSSLRVASALGRLARKYRGVLGFIQLDIPEGMEDCLASIYGIDRLPAVLFLSGGRKWGEIAGPASKERLEEGIEVFLKELGGAKRKEVIDIERGQNILDLGPAPGSG